MTSHNTASELSYPKGYFAVINRETDKDNEQKWPQFCGKNLKIFNSILTDTLEIEESYKQDGLNDWKVTFFKDSPFSQTLALQTVDEKPLTGTMCSIATSKVNKESVAANIALVDRLNKAEDITHICESASKFVCNNKAVTKEHLKNLPSERRYIDGKGLILLKKYSSNTGEVDQPKRQILLLMLAVAYYQAFQQISEELALALEKSDEVDKIEELYESAARFNARYYFFNPVKINNYATFTCWQDIRDAYKLQTQYHELNQQIEQVHSILGHRRKQREEKESIERQQENESWYKKITVLGLVLSLLGIIEVVSTLVETLGKELGLGFGVLIVLFLIMYAKPMFAKSKSKFISTGQ